MEGLALPARIFCSSPSQWSIALSIKARASVTCFLMSSLIGLGIFDKNNKKDEIKVGVGD
jgi:hypothetical protein